MSVTGELEELDDGNFTGWIGSLTFDVDVVVSENPHKQKDQHPDFAIFAKTPRGRDIRVGSVWKQAGRESGKPYLSLAIDVNGTTLRANAFQDGEDSKKHQIVPFANQTAQ